MPKTKSYKYIDI